MNEMATYARENDVKIYILVQYSEQNIEYPEVNQQIVKVKKVINCVDRPLHLIDLHSSIVELRNNDNAKYKSYMHVHMTKEGNYFVANFLKDAIFRTDNF